MPMRSLGRPSINLRVTSRTASSRVASSPPIVKSLVSIEFETSRTSIMSMPLASTSVRLLPSCGRARATTNKASANSSKVRRNLPARETLLFPISCSNRVEENVTAAAEPRLPRRYATSGISRSNNSSSGRANVRAPCAADQSRNSDKLLSPFHKPRRLLQQQGTVGGSCVVSSKFDQVATTQKILEQCSFLWRKLRIARDSLEKLNGRLSGNRQPILFGYITSQNVRGFDAELICVDVLYSLRNFGQRLQCAVPWQLWRDRPRRTMFPPPDRCAQHT